VGRAPATGEGAGGAGGLPDGSAPSLTTSGVTSTGAPPDTAR